jgi:hypothetical protein
LEKYSILTSKAEVSPEKNSTSWKLLSYSSLPLETICRINGGDSFARSGLASQESQLFQKVRLFDQSDQGLCFAAFVDCRSLIVLCFGLFLGIFPV